jgi:hypothetical protein
MREQDVYEALERYLQAAIAASISPPEDLPRCEALAGQAQLEYQNALEAFHLRLRMRRTQDFAPVQRAAPEK